MKEILNLKEAVALAIKEARSETKLSQRKLAEKISCSRAYIDSIETGKYQPTLNAFMQIATALGITEEELFRRVKWHLVLLNNSPRSESENTPL